MDTLPVFVRLRGARVILVGDGEAAAAKARLIAAAGGIVVRDLPATLAFVALADAGEAEAAATRLRAAGLLVNVVDRPALCDFTVPAIVDRSPVIVAVGTGGASASLAKALRERLEALLPASLGALATAIFAARATVAARAPTIDARRRLWDAALAPGGALDPLSDIADPAAAIATLGDPARAPDLTTIALASPDPDDLTLRQLRALNQADTIVHDPAVPPAVLDRARRDAVRVAGAVPRPLPVGRTVVLDAAFHQPRPERARAAVPVTIRAATPGDADAIWAMLEPVVRAGETLALDRDLDRAAALALWLGPDRATFVAEDAGVILGNYYLRANHGGGGGHVANAGYLTAPAARGCGVGRAMGEHSLDAARARGFQAMQFNLVVGTNAAAVHLWRSLGFAVVGRLPGAFAHPVDGRVDALVMFRAL